MRFAVLPLLLVACSSASSSAEGPGADGDAVSEAASGDAASEVPFDGALDAPTPDAADGSAPEAGGSSFRFAYVGCNRLSAKDATPANPSTANLEQLKRTLDELTTLSPRPAIFFLAGDMVLGLTDAPTLETQLIAWKAIWEASTAKSAGITLVALPGNHESETKDAAGNELPYAGAEAIWLTQMAPYIAGSNGPKAGAADGLPTDQSKLTYSFDRGSTHFVVMNTDPMGTSGGTVPVKWIAADVAAARTAGAKHIFAIGHKPAWPAPSNPADGFTSIAARDALFAALEDAKAEALLSAHNHLWFKTQPHAGKTWQIIAGNGGSKLEKGLSGGYFGFTVVDVDDAKATVTSYGRDVPSAGYLAPASSAAYPTTIRETVDVTMK